MATLNGEVATHVKCAWLYSEPACELMERGVNLRPTLHSKRLRGWTVGQGSPILETEGGYAINVYDGNTPSSRGQMY